MNKEYSVLEINNGFVELVVASFLDKEEAESVAKEFSLLYPNSDFKPLDMESYYIDDSNHLVMIEKD